MTAAATTSARASHRVEDTTTASLAAVADGPDRPRPAPLAPRSPSRPPSPPPSLPPAPQLAIAPRSKTSAIVAAASASATAEAAADRERQTLLLMLLAQVCSLHDPTPRTFVVHVLALFERGVLDRPSVAFLHDLGLVPGNPLGTTTVTAGTGTGAGEESFDYLGGVNFLDADLSLGGSLQDDGDSVGETSRENGPATGTLRTNRNERESESEAIVPYDGRCGHLATRSATFSASSSSPSCDSTAYYSHRRREASVIRTRLEQHVSSDCGGGHNESVGGGGTESGNYHSWKRPSSTQAQISAEASFDASPPSVTRQPQPRGYVAHPDHQLIPDCPVDFDFAAPPPSSSWSVEHHPLSLSRYRREFREVDLLASGSFGSVYHAVNILDGRDYAVKRVAFYNRGYGRKALGVVVREVRCLARLDHPNCVRYYTAWWEPSWMTGEGTEAVGAMGEGGGDEDFDDDGDEDFDDDGDEDGGDNDEDEDGSSRDDIDDVAHAVAGKRQAGRRWNDRRLLLTDVERVVQSIRGADARSMDESLNELGAILSRVDATDDGSDDNDGDDDEFEWEWASPSKGPRSGGVVHTSVARDYSAFSFERSENSNRGRWDDLPSHRTESRSLDASAAGDENDCSEWTQDLTDGGDRGRGGDVSDCSEWTRQPTHGGFVGSSLSAATKGGGRPRDLVRAAPPEPRPAPSPPISSSYRYRITLFVQMQLCRPSTLADWIRRRNTASSSASVGSEFDEEEPRRRAGTAFEIFRQIVKGLAHVHENGIIHRDLKPANVFAAEGGQFKIGDFGLSKLLGEPTEKSDVGPNFGGTLTDGGDSGVHTSGVGTASYASPEQLARQDYGPAADVFSLGLILLELFSSFSSEHERSTAFRDLREKGEVSPRTARMYPEVSALVSACVRSSPTERPTAAEIRAADVSRETNGGVEVRLADLCGLRLEIERKDEEIEGQNELLAEKDGIIEKLRRRIAEVEGGGADTVWSAALQSVSNGDPFGAVNTIDSSSEDDY